MAKPPTVDPRNTRVTAMDVTDFQFPVLVAPDWALQLWNAFAEGMTTEQRIHTGYANKADRRSERARRWRDGLMFGREAVAA